MAGSHSTRLHTAARPLRVPPMADDGTPPLGSGAHGRVFPALPEHTRTAILEGFNANNRRFFSGQMGLRVVDLRYMIKSMPPAPGTKG